MHTVTQPGDNPLPPPDAAVPYFRALPAPHWAVIDAWEAAHGLPPEHWPA